MSGRSILLTAGVALAVVLLVELAANFGFDVRRIVPRRKPSLAASGDVVREGEAA